MSFPRSDPARSLSSLLCIGALLCVAILTIIDRGATRAYATPWIYLFWFAHVAPFLALALRALPGAPALILPNRNWCLLAALFSGYVLLSALLSPFRGPSLHAALTPLAGVAAFLLIHDASRHDSERFTKGLLRAVKIVAVCILAVSMGRWFVAVCTSGSASSVSAVFNHRNDFPLGHSNTTAGLALLILPWCGFQAWRMRGYKRAGWTIASVLALAMLFTSGSRGALLGLAVLAVVGVIYARVNRRILGLLVLLVATATLAFAYAHPRTRAMLFSRTAFSAEANVSNVQRSAMAIAGWRMGVDRPLPGWGPGTTPLVYPRYRSGVDGGVENAFQLHSTPVQLWADLGIGGALCMLAGVALICSGFRRPVRPPHASSAATSHTCESAWSGQHPLHAPALATVAGYGAFALTDYQLDIPVFTLVLAGCIAIIARSPVRAASRRTQFSTAVSAILVLAIVGIWGHRDPTAELNVRALELGRDPAQVDQAIVLLEQSLAHNPDQEISHFNLGWLLVVRDPAAAEDHFLAAAQLVPDKGGVYFGLALARLNHGRPERTREVVRALALESLNDPRFLISPWWRQAEFAALRAATITELNALASNAAFQLAARKDRRSREAEYVAVLGEWLDGRSLPGEILRRSYTSQRVSYFAARPPLPDWKNAGVISYRRERTAYPILMRNMDLAPPLDLFEVQENSLATGELAALFPLKGWLPAPLLLDMLRKPLTEEPAIAP